MKHLYQHLKAHERDLIAVWKSKGLSNKQIAKRLNRSVSSIGRETKRNRRPDGYYVSIRAQTLTRKRQRAGKRRHPLKTPAVYSYVLEKLRTGWSPEQISGRLKKEQGHPVICHETIYRFIYDSDNQDKRLWEYLPRNQKSRRKQNGRSVHKVRIPQRVSIHLRPTAIDLRTEFGHWEGDTVEGRKSERDGIHTEVERLSRLMLAGKVTAIDSPKTLSAQVTMFSRLPDSARKSTTLDNGRENHLHFGLTDRLGMRTFFADPYSSCQRATNENSNGLIRRYLPKGTSFKDLTQDELNDMVWEINNRPRKCLGYNTSTEVFEKHLRVAL